MMTKVMNILFVCTGNTCRSVMAEGFFKKLKNTSSINVNSAGINALNEMPPTKEAIIAMKNYGIDVSKHKSKKLTNKLLKSADYIFVMTSEHIKDVIKLDSFAKGKTFLLKKFARTHNKNTRGKILINDEIDDPIGKGMECYEDVAKKIYKNVFLILEKLDKGTKSKKEW